MSTELVVLDIDRTLLKTTNFSRKIAQPLGELLDLTTEQVTAMREAAMQSEGAVFDYLSWIGETIPLDDQKRMLLQDSARITAAIMKYYRSERGEVSRHFAQDILIDGVDTLLDALHATGAKVLLLTAGGATLQSIKAQIVQQLVGQRSADYALIIADYIVVSTHQPKTQLLADCFDTAHFHLERLLDKAKTSQIADINDYSMVEQCTILDDKFSNVASVDDARIIGVAVWIEGEEGRVEPGEPDVLQRQSLSEIAASLRP